LGSEEARPILDLDPLAREEALLAALGAFSVDLDGEQ
jgi:hypothetical protein